MKLIINESGDTVTGHEGSGTEVIVPYGIKTIGREAFADAKCDMVILPDSIERIEEAAFSGCEMKTISLPDKEIAINNYEYWYTSAFYYNLFLRKVVVRGKEGDMVFPVFRFSGELDVYYQMKLIAERDWSVKIPAKYKNVHIALMFLAKIDGAGEYVSRGTVRIFKSICEEGRFRLAEALVKSGRFITEKNSAKLAAYAESIGKSDLAELIRKQ